MKLIIYKMLCGLMLVASMHQTSALSLAEELTQQDAEFFQRGFNECDIDYLQQHVSKDLVFYHDQGGIQHKSNFMSSVLNNICSNHDEKPIRKLVEGSIETFPLYKNGKLYGAIQQGEHEFYIRKVGYTDRLTSTAKFTHVWLKDNDQWLLSNVLSYDHVSPDTDGFIETLLVDSKVPALGIGVIEAGKIKSIKAYGERKKGEPATEDTIFKVASLTKPIVAFVALKLVGEGKLELDEPLHPYWVDPDLVDDNRHKLLTVRHVLTHQTGFDNWRWMNTEKTLKFNFTPGTQHQYSGEGFEYLRKALESKFDTTIEELAQQYLFTPAGMTDTHFWWDDSVDEERYAYNHDENGQQIKLEKYYTANAAANLLTTVGDYTRFLIYMMEQSSKNPELYNNIISKQIDIGENHHFGLGWEMFTGFSNDEFALLHTGRDPGVNTLAMFFPNSNNGYVIFMNGDNSMPILEHILTTLYLGHELWQRR
ncbi:serine hydrolase [Kangiella koreensis]|uniref:Beta-lactamase n=1 Tax=Kangiella koreensis (strain DSM 16069 / JCM 12317 / KCTC 12182 / SW-125) TaxID=523791 RepID=C7RBL7_KANKD|nr:serine hydrolase [Kangiella koreensis]ACV26659.1 beta-lactamase [Kangiella koreensis DSM 16069]